MPSVQCSFTIEKRIKGKRYVQWRRRCRRMTTHPSGRCPSHREGA